MIGSVDLRFGFTFTFSVVLCRARAVVMSCQACHYFSVYEYMCSIASYIFQIKNRLIFLRRCWNASSVAVSSYSLYSANEAFLVQLPTENQTPYNHPLLSIFPHKDHVHALANNRKQ